MRMEKPEDFQEELPMEPVRVRKLYEQIEEVIRTWRDETTGTLGDFHKYVRVTPHSNSIASVIFEKKTAGQWVLFLFVWKNSWQKFMIIVPSDADLLGFLACQGMREICEEHNVHRVVVPDFGKEPSD